MSNSTIITKKEKLRTKLKFINVVRHNHTGAILRQAFSNAPCLVRLSVKKTAVVLRNFSLLFGLYYFSLFFHSSFLPFRQYHFLLFLFRLNEFQMVKVFFSTQTFSQHKSLIRINSQCDSELWNRVFATNHKREFPFWSVHIKFRVRKVSFLP